SEVLAAAVAGLAIGLLPYSAFLLLARGYYALGDSRTPGVVSVASAAGGVVVMALGWALAGGAALIYVLGLGHSAAYPACAAVLGVGLARRTGGSLWPAAAGRVAAVSAAVGLAAWAAGRALVGGETAQLPNLAAVAGIGLVGAGLVIAGYRLTGVRAALTERTPTPPAAGTAVEVSA